uniref:C-type lectin domain-containing protein n=1 Tax=Syphacia muris TaxID=451379 RepID=A0A0N5AHQ7_9BILA
MAFDLITRPCYGHFDSQKELEEAHLTVSYGDNIFCLHVIVQSDLTTFDETEGFCSRNYNGHLLYLRNWTEAEFIANRYMPQYFVGNSYLVLGIKNLSAKQEFVDGSTTRFIGEFDWIGRNLSETSNQCYLIEHRQRVYKPLFRQVKCTSAIFAIFVCKEVLASEGDRDMSTNSGWASAFKNRFFSVWIYVYGAVLVLLIISIIAWYWIRKNKRDDREVTVNLIYGFRRRSDEEIVEPRKSHISCFEMDLL